MPVKQLKMNPARTQAVSPALQALLSKSAELKAFAQGALIAYLRSVFLQPDKKARRRRRRCWAGPGALGPCFGGAHPSLSPL